tara:strand:+ start:992 stop:1879 length:888 start_codon:yes stop_codon:yes gene_type:complete
MKIGYFADGTWSHKAIEKILENKNFKICFIVPRYETQDPILKEWANKIGVKYLTIKNINDKKSIELLKKYNADIFVSMSFDQIFREDVLSLPKLGTINCHAGALPFYRGRNILNWVLINDESSFGVTVHYIDKGIDTGDIILQHKEKITDEDDYSSLLSKATNICAQLLYKALINILSGKIIKIKQKDIDGVGSYCRKRLPGDENINWILKNREIFNFVRSINTPGPCARAFIKNNEIKIKEVSISKTINGVFKIGEIIKEGNNVYVKTTDGFLKLKKYETNNDFILQNGDFFKI